MRLVADAATNDSGRREPAAEEEDPYMNTRVIAAGLSAVALAAPAGSIAGRSNAAKSFKLSAAMTPKQVVTPKNKQWPVPASVRNGKGTFSGTVSSDGRRLSWKVSYSGIGRPKLAIADIHYGKRGQFGPTLGRLCGPCHSPQTGVAKLKKGFSSQFRSGNTWVTLITDKYPNGVMRGQIRAR